MKRYQITLLIVAFAACFVAITFRERPLTADIHANELVVDSKSRNYRLVIPHETVRPMPIVFAFHGVGDSTDSMAGYSGLDRTAARNGFILVYPAAHNSMWATINVDPSNLDANPDVRFFDQLLTHLTSAYDVDRDRIYLVGMSNGASFAQLLATARSDMVAALVAHSGSRLKGLDDLDNPIPIMLVVGADDSVSSIMQSDADKYRTHGHTVEYVSVPRLAHNWSTSHNEQMWRFLSQHFRRIENVAEQSHATRHLSHRVKGWWSKLLFLWG